jgi:hypothetical protein
MVQKLRKTQQLPRLHYWNNHVGGLCRTLKMWQRQKLRSDVPTAVKVSTEDFCVLLPCSALGGWLPSWERCNLGIARSHTPKYYKQQNKDYFSCRKLNPGHQVSIQLFYWLSNPFSFSILVYLSFSILTTDWMSGQPGFDPRLR